MSLLITALLLLAPVAQSTPGFSQDAGSLTVRVRWPGGQPWQGVIIGLSSPDGLVQPNHRWTNTAGEAHFPALCPGEDYEVRVSATHFQPLDFEGVSVSPGENTVILASPDERMQDSLAYLQFHLGTVWRERRAPDVRAWIRLRGEYSESLGHYIEIPDGLVCDDVTRAIFKFLSYGAENTFSEYSRWVRQAFPTKHALDHVTGQLRAVREVNVAKLPKCRGLGPGPSLGRIGWTVLASIASYGELDHARDGRALIKLVRAVTARGETCDNAREHAITVWALAETAASYPDIDVLQLAAERSETRLREMVASDEFGALDAGWPTLVLNLLDVEYESPPADDCSAPEDYVRLREALERPDQFRRNLATPGEHPFERLLRTLYAGKLPLVRAYWNRFPAQRDQR